MLPFKVPSTSTMLGFAPVEETIPRRATDRVPKKSIQDVSQSHLFAKRCPLLSPIVCVLTCKYLVVDYTATQTETMCSETMALLSAFDSTCRVFSRLLNPLQDIWRLSSKVATLVELALEHPYERFSVAVVQYFARFHLGFPSRVYIGT